MGWLEGLCYLRIDMQAALGGPDVKEIAYAAGVKYVLVVLARGSNQQELQALQPDFVRLKQLIRSKDVTGVMVTCQGGACSDTSWN